MSCTPRTHKNLGRSCTSGISRLRDHGRSRKNMCHKRAEVHSCFANVLSWGLSRRLCRNVHITQWLRTAHRSSVFHALCWGVDASRFPLRLPPQLQCRCSDAATNNTERTWWRPCLFFDRGGATVRHHLCHHFLSCHMLLVSYLYDFLHLAVCHLLRRGIATQDVTLWHPSGPGLAPAILVDIKCLVPPHPGRRVAQTLCDDTIVIIPKCHPICVLVELLPLHAERHGGSIL
jgi:hypothetical protein